MSLHYKNQNNNNIINDQILEDLENSSTIRENHNS